MFIDLRSSVEIFHNFQIIVKQPPEVFCKKKVLLEVSQNLQENTCASLFFNKIAGLRLY